MLTTTRKTCIRPAHNELLTIRSTSSEHITTINDVNGVLNLECVFIHQQTGTELYVRQLHCAGNFTLYGVLSDRFPNKRYLVQWAPTLNRFGCSCIEGRTIGYCKHCEEVEAYATKEVQYV